ncbi:probable E3 ubiquitin-protein ligase RHG1A [Phragmites australis]|uniref:probable E3 ubiquitin-protein ligase RHG1A n=1 Tax=Phragmites australis TaxID=29695 RepID=UPI002D79F403|nr:probable E3 ubiquitin-protein ligase RHG1A [Phragmites australis]
MARHTHNNSQMSRMDHVNRLQNEPPPFGQNLFMHPRSDAPNGALSLEYGNATMRTNDLPSSSYAGQSHTQQIVAPRPLHASYAGYPHPGSSSSIYAPHNSQHLPALSYPHRSEDNFILSSHIVDRSVAQKRRNPIIHPMDGASVGSFYAASSSNAQFSHYMPPNSIPAPESCPLSKLGSRHWSEHHFGNHGGSQRNVRGRYDHNSIHLGHSQAVASSSSSTHGPPHHANAIAPSLRTAAPFSVPPRVVPPVTNGYSSLAFRERPYYPAPQRTNISAPVTTLPGSSDNVPFAHGGYAPRAAPHNTVHTYPAPVFATSSNSGAVSYEPAVPSYPPAVLPATSAAASSVLPFHAETTASLRHLGHATGGPSGSARNRRLRDSYHSFHPLMIEENNLGRSAAARFMMLDQLVIHESREASDPHWDMRLDIDDMSYEQLLALEERIGNVNTGLANEKISSCVMEVACCSSGRTCTQNDQENASCIICLEEYKLEDSLGRLRCGHDFHADCVKKWLQVKNACPVCKAAAAADDSGGIK